LSAIGLTELRQSAAVTNHELALLKLLSQCKAVIGCRLSPAHKAVLVRLVEMHEPSSVTLAIGDGGNDVSMIQEAAVGVGIMGNEGRQAVNASDFAISTFRLLADLLLVHGRHNYRRVALVILYSFYKNIVLVFVLLLYSLDNGASGMTLFESYLGTGWNVAFTALPVLVVGVLDLDLTPEMAFAHPEVYAHRSMGERFSVSRLFLWATNGIIHASLLYGAARVMLLGKLTSPDGKSSGLWLQGTAVNLALVISVNGKLALESNTQGVVFWISIGLSLGLWFLFVLVY